MKHKEALVPYDNPVPSLVFYEEGQTTIPKGSRFRVRFPSPKCQPSFHKDEDMVYSLTEISGNRGCKRYAKTLYKPTRPDVVHEKINSYTNKPLPHFFKYAKDKKGNQICDVNMSFVNKLESIVKNPRLSFRKLDIGKIDHRLLMHDPSIEVNVSLTGNGRIIEEETDPVVVEYNKFSKEYYLAIDSSICSASENRSDSYMRAQLKHRRIANEIRSSLSKFGHSDVEIADILVKYLYDVRPNSMNKAALWMCYGDIIYDNLSSKIKYGKKAVQCVDCGEWFEVSVFDSESCRCKECYEEYRRAYYREKKREQRAKAKMSTAPLTQ